jgi:hypothetical protein
MPFGKRKKRPDISSPTNFEHRVHSGFDHNNGVFVGLPTQWNSIINENDQFKLQHNFNSLNQHVNLTKGMNLNSHNIESHTNEGNILSNNIQNFRPKPIVDPSRITPTELICFKTIVRGQQSSSIPSKNSPQSTANSQFNNQNQMCFNASNLNDVNNIVANSNALRQHNQINNILNTNLINRHQPVRNINQVQLVSQQLSPVAETKKIQSNPNITRIMTSNNDTYTSGNQNVEYVYNVNGAAKINNMSGNNSVNDISSGFSKIVYPTTSISSSSAVSSSSSTSSPQQQQLNNQLVNKASYKDIPPPPLPPAHNINNSIVCNSANNESIIKRLHPPTPLSQIHFSKNSNSNNNFSIPKGSISINTTPVKDNIINHSQNNKKSPLKQSKSYII